MPLRLLLLLLALLCAVPVAGAQEPGATPETIEEGAERLRNEAAGQRGGDDAALIEGEGAHGDADAHGPPPPLFLVLPFAALLLMIATGPLFYPHHWHHRHYWHHWCPGRPHHSDWPCSNHHRRCPGQGRPNRFEGQSQS